MYVMPNSKPRNHARQRLSGLRGLGSFSITPGTYPNGPYSTGQNQSNLMAQQAVVDQNPTDYSSPQYAIAAGLDPVMVNAAWVKGLAQYPTQQAAINAGIMPAVVTQLWAQSRQYGQIAAAAPNYAPMVAIGVVVVLLAMLHVGDKGGDE
jgi:hypothetical protein